MTKETIKIAVSYAYPTSPYAIAFGKSKTGCFVLEFINQDNTATAERSFDTEEEAYIYADQLKLPYSRYDRRTYERLLKTEGNL